MLLMAPAAGIAAGELSAEQAVQQALLRPDLSTLIEADVQAARGTLAETRTWPNPELNIERTSADLPGRAGDETRLMLSQAFELGGRRGLQRRAAELGVDAAQSRAIAEREQVRVEVLTGYYRLVIEQRRRQLLTSWVEELGDLTRLATQRADAGDLSGYAARRIGQRGSFARARLDAAEADVETARNQLAVMLGVAAAELQVDTGMDLLPREGALVERLAVEAVTHPEVAALARQRDAAAALERAAARPALPVRLGVGQQRQYGAFGRDDALVVEASLPLPLFDRNQAGRLRAQAEYMRAEGRFSQTERALQSRLPSAQRNTERLVQQARHQRSELLPEAQALADIARARFIEGEADLADLLGALDARIETVEHLLDLELRAGLAWLELDALTRNSQSIPEDQP